MWWSTHLYAPCWWERPFNPDHEPWFISQNHSSWADFPGPINDCCVVLCVSLSLSLLLGLFSLHRLTSHLWISHGPSDNSWSLLPRKPQCFGLRFEWQVKHINGWQTGSVWLGAKRGVRRQWLRPFSQPRDWKYQRGAREPLPSAQCLATLETNVALLTFTPTVEFSACGSC